MPEPLTQFRNTKALQPSCSTLAEISDALNHKIFVVARDISGALYLGI